MFTTKSELRERLNKGDWTNPMNTPLMQAIDDAIVGLEEANEAGDPEERLESSQHLDYLEKLLKQKQDAGVEAEYLPCGMCGGSGKHKEYGESFDCGACHGRGGSFK